MNVFDVSDHAYGIWNDARKKKQISDQVEPVEEFETRENMR